jgi:ribose 5-phosphate isomerase B
VRVAVGGDHAGYALKSQVARYLDGLGHEVVDYGTDSDDPVDYPAFCASVARAVAEGGVDFGVVFGGSGQGEQIAANKVRGARAALCHNEETARLARAHNDANVLALGGRLLEAGLALKIVVVFLATGFDGGRHLRRVGQIAEIERQEYDAMDGQT